MTEKSKRVAVFIDAENISHEYAERILSEASNYGDVIIKRIYADWSKPHTKSWKEKVPMLSLKPEQNFAAVSGKNSSDISLMVDVLTSFFERQIDIFCLASSDSDYTRLVQELKEREKKVVGFGKTQTAAPAYVNTFSEFIYLDKVDKKSSQQATKDELLPPVQLSALREIVENLIEHHGKALYGSIGTEMKNKFSDFIPKNYGYKTLSDLMSKNLKQIGNYKITREEFEVYLTSNNS